MRNIDSLDAVNILNFTSTKYLIWMIPMQKYKVQSIDAPTLFYAHPTNTPCCILCNSDSTHNEAVATVCHIPHEHCLHWDDFELLFLNASKPCEIRFF